MHARGGGRSLATSSARCGDAALYGLPASTSTLRPAISAACSAMAYLILIAPMWQAVEALPHGFDPTDRLLLHHGSLLADAYDAWFKRWNTAQNVRPPYAHRRLAGAAVLATCGSVCNLPAGC